MSDENDIVDLASRRKAPGTPVSFMTLPERPEMPAGPFTLTISDSRGKMYEVVFPDFHGELPPDAAILGTAGCGNLVVNLLTGALRVFAGEP